MAIVIDDEEYNLLLKRSERLRRIDEGEDRDEDRGFVRLNRRDARKVLDDLEHAEQLISDLQAAGTALVELKREQDVTYCVAMFHHKFGYPVRTTPQIPSDDEVRFRGKLLVEEFIETLRAMFADPIFEGRCYGRGYIDHAEALLFEVIREGEVMVDLVELADGLCDLDYITEGTRQYFGIPRADVLKEVQRSNMDKSLSKDTIGKPVKPEGWKPPDILAVLRARGWSG